MSSLFQTPKSLVRAAFRSGILAAALIGYGAGVQAQPLGVSSIDISTGRNHAASADYPYSGPASAVSDAYWTVTMVPANTVNITAPFCAKVLDSTMYVTTVSSGPFVSQVQVPSGCRWIGVTPVPTSVPSGLDGPSGFFWTYHINSGGPLNGAKPVRFTRRFKVNGTGPQAVTVTLNGGAADDIFFARVDATPGVPIYTTGSGNLYYNPGTNTTTSFAGPVSQTLQLAPGVHTLDVDVYDQAAVITCLALQGTISAAAPVLSDNASFGADTSCGGTLPPAAPCAIADLEVIQKQRTPLQARFAADATPLNASVQWDFGDGTTGTTTAGQGITHPYATAGSYRVCATIYTATGTVCAERCMSVCVADTGNLGVQPPQSGSEPLRLGTLYPNPTSAELSIPIESPKAQPATLQLTAVTGEVLRSQTESLHAGANLLRMPTHTLKNGPYILQVVVADGLYTQMVTKVD